MTNASATGTDEGRPSWTAPRLEHLRGQDKILSTSLGESPDFGIFSDPFS